MTNGNDEDAVWLRKQAALIRSASSQGVVQIEASVKAAERLERIASRLARPDSKVVEALDPFARVAAIADALHEQLPDDTPCRQFFPGIWPTLGDCRKAREVLSQQTGGSR